MTHGENAIKAPRKTKITILLLAALILLTLTFASASGSGQTQPKALKSSTHVFQSATSLARSFDNDLNDHNSSAGLALFEDGATVSDLSNIACLPGPPPSCQGENVFIGKTQIRGWLEQLVGINVQLNETEPFQVSGSNVSWEVQVSVDEYRRLGVAPLNAAINGIVEDGKFSYLSIGLTADSTSKLAEAYAASRATPYSVMAGGVGLGVIFLGLVFPAVGVYYVSKVKRLFASVPHLDKPWLLLGAGLGVLFVSVLLLLLRYMGGVSSAAIDPLLDLTLTICAFLVMSSMFLMKRVMIGGSNE